MARIRLNRRLGATIAIMCCVAIAAGLRAQRHSESRAQEKVPSGAAAQGMTSAQELSAAPRVKRSGTRVAEAGRRYSAATIAKA